MRHFHIFKPIFNEDSRILILGSFPSVISREENFYYANPSNRFWNILQGLLNKPFVNATTEQKKQFMLDSKIALWDIVESCEIKGSADSDIKSAKPNDLNIILDSASIKAIFCNGTLSYKLLKHFYPNLKAARKLPSSSPANARYNLESLLESWKVILEA